MPRGIDAFNDTCLPARHFRIATNLVIKMPNDSIIIDKAVMELRRPGNNGRG